MSPEIANKKWFEKKWLLIILLFILPPMGIYGVLKRNPRFWKKLVYTFFASFMILYWIVLFGALIFPFDYYEEGLNKLQTGNLQLAIQNFEKVKITDVNYNNALYQINLANQKLNEQKILNEEILKKKNEKLSEFQKQWSDSIVKDWNGSYIKKSLINSLDTITFQLTKKASTGYWQSSAELNQAIYQKDYDSLVNRKFPSDYSNIKTQILFIADPEQEIVNEGIAKRKQLIDGQFSGYDGSNRNVERYIKENMNDPDSYDHIETTYTDKGSYILVYTKFRGTNSYGAKIIQVATAKVDINGNVLSIK